MDPISITTYLGYITSAVTNAATWLVQGGNGVQNSPIALTLFAVGFCGIGIGLFKRIVRIF